MSLLRTIFLLAAFAEAANGSPLAEPGSHQQVIAEMTERIKKNPHDAEALFLRGAHRTALNDCVSAVKDFNQSLKVEPASYAALVDRGACLRRLGDLKGAMRDYNKAIELNPRAPSAFINRGHVLQTMKDYDGALTDFRTAVQLDPTLRSKFSEPTACGFVWVEESRTIELVRSGCGK